MNAHSAGAAEKEIIIPHVFGWRVFLIFSFLLMLQGVAQKALPTGPTDLRILTINVWSGLDYKGVIRMGEYEPAERRKLRFQALLRQIQEINPDIIFIQEANPVAKYSAKLADSLGFDEIHQDCRQESNLAR